VGESIFKYTSLPIHTVTLTGLQPWTLYHYRVGDGVNWSADLTFTAPPNNKAAAPAEVSWAIFGDMGTTVPMGAEVTKSLTKEHATKPFNVLLHVGDLCYAGVNHDGEWEPTWVLCSYYHLHVLH
jgi:phosphodiesterase/alkaline phosphatase D-like protein